MPAPLIAISADLYTRKDRPYARVAMAYADRVAKAGGIPVVLAPIQGAVESLADRFDGYILTGGDDPRTEPFGVDSHPEITPVLEPRQQFESSLLDSIQTTRPEVPLFGICLGMQFMALHAGGSLHQHMPESHPKTHQDHWGADHDILPESDRLTRGISHSHHKQAVDSPGSLRVLARAPDGVIEAVGDPDRPFLLGVQWHPERTDNHDLGQRLFNEFVESAKAMQIHTPSR